MTIEVLPQKFTVCKVQELSASMLNEPFCFIGKTDKELSIVCESCKVPGKTLKQEDGWRGFRISETLDFSLVGILSDISTVLSEEHISIFALSTFDTDYILCREDQLHQALSCLKQRGYMVVI